MNHEHCDVWNCPVCANTKKAADTPTQELSDDFQIGKNGRIEIKKPGLQVACNDCGAGKPLYFRRYRKEFGDGVPQWVEFSGHRQTLRISAPDNAWIRVKCPKCGSHDLEIIPTI